VQESVRRTLEALRQAKEELDAMKRRWTLSDMVQRDAAAAALDPYMEPPRACWAWRRPMPLRHSFSTADEAFDAVKARLDALRGV
jgi:hypothetical protein